MTRPIERTARESDTERSGSEKRENAASKDTNPKDAIGSSKVPLHLLSPVAKAYWALAQFAGTVKYGAWNWRVAGVRSSVYLAAMARHMDAYFSGEDYDPVDGVHHLGAVMACAAILLDAKEVGKLTDDRPPSVPVKGAYTDAENRMMALRNMYADLSPTHYTMETHEKAPGSAKAQAPDPAREIYSGPDPAHCAVCGRTHPFATRTAPESAPPVRKFPSYNSFYWEYTP